MKTLLQIVFLIGVVYVGYMYRDKISTNLSTFQTQYFPCKQTINYSLGDFDIKFGISEGYFINALKEAEDIWEQSSGRDLFAYKTDGHLKINLIYDSRQETTSKLKAMGLAVEDTRTSYNELKSKYDNLYKNYQKDKSALDTLISAFNDRKQRYQDQIEAYNQSGGAKEEDVVKMNGEQEYLNKQVKILNQSQSELNKTASNINALATTLNELANSLNIDVQKYNKIGDTLGGEFEEGTYVRDDTGERINVYQFDNRTKLVRVLAHELGHALGLEHVDDQKAIMYRLNNGVNGELTDSDKEALEELCK